ncbi:YceD family protein [Bifidobacterium catulorum]|uniref:DNA-binding protein n=1 Tax=Bifidobacterium catulorum TaxID=1630173 RepID=A0A2U2MT13_9BIFI|nr:DUF177 domain-containing protein [Bifidobacterium catulorum]PWG59972.1 DNA-binding protein [Bifidobacterium catulorum]
MNDIHPESSPWAIPVAQVAARPGQSKAIDQDFPAPDGIGDEVISVRKDADVHVDGSFDSIVDGLIFNGAVTAPITAECSRCLKPLNASHTIHVTAFFPYAPDAHDQHRGGKGKGEEVDIIAGEEESDDFYPLAGNNTFADIESLLRDNLVEALPLKPLCRPDCRGLCPQCGIDLNEEPDHHHDVPDIRWSALESLKARLEAEQGGESNG